MPQYERFAGKVGRVVTVNYGGKAIVDFADGAWYDIPATAEYLEVVPDEEAKGKYDATANSAQKLPAGRAEHPRQDSRWDETSPVHGAIGLSGIMSF